MTNNPNIHKTRLWKMKLRLQLGELRLEFWNPYKRYCQRLQLEPSLRTATCVSPCNSWGNDPNLGFMNQWIKRWEREMP